jgi:MYXO-CTERM domain-containing protein
MKGRRLALWLGLAAVCLTASPALGHWCDDNWGSAYNLVVRPAQDQVTVPASGTVTLDVYVQNNIGEALRNFVLNATATGYTIAVAGQAGVRTGYLMPGEKLRYTLTISRSGGGSLGVDAIVFTVSFGDGGQSSQYGEPARGKDVVVRKNDGSLVPSGTGTGWSGIDTGNTQARHLYKAAKADYANVGAGFDDLVGLYCAGRRSWDGSGGTYSADCPDATTAPPTCPTRSVTADGSKYDFQQLWAAQELASRKPELTKAAYAAQLTKLRKGLRCGWDDTHTVFKYMAGFLLGYLGEDAQARSFLEGVIAGSEPADNKTAAKAALMLMGSAADATLYHADVVAGLSSSNTRLKIICAAVLGILDHDDDAVKTQLIPNAVWTCPTTDCGTPDNGTKIFGAHVLAVVAWSRRAYAPLAGDTGEVSFYSQAPPDTTPPAVATGVSCTASPGGTVRVRWNQVSIDTSGSPENVTEYRIYSGNSPRTSGCTDPGCATDYSHSDSAAGSATYRDFPSLDGTQTYYFAVVAVDAAGNHSHYSTEASCVPVYAPTAVISCNPTSGAPPLTVTCNSTGSSDPNGAGDIATRTFSLDGQTPSSGATVSYDFTTVASHVVVLRVTDQGGLSDTDQVAITVGSAPTAVAAANPTTGQAPLEVAFDSTGSHPNGAATITYSWDFKDGSAVATEANPTHTFADPGVYDVTLTVTDDAVPPASGFAVVTVTALGNNPPDVSAAYATPLFGDLPLVVTFDASGVTDPDGNNVTVEWDFGDGSPTSTELAVDHTYASAGQVTAHLTATDDYSPPASATRSFVINPGGGPPTNTAPDCTAATVTPSEGPAPLAVTLDASGCTDADGNALSFLWRVPTSLTTEDQLDTATAQYTFDEEGEVTITLAVTDDAAQPMTTTREFVVTVGGGAGRGRQLTGCVCRAGGGTGPGPGVLLLLGVALALGGAWRRRR